MEKPKKLETVALVANTHLDRSGVALLKKIIRFLKKRQVKILYEKNARSYLKPKPKLSRCDYIMRRADLVVTLGGDGTLIKLAQHTERRVLPVLSINLGTVGFLTEIQKPEKVLEALEQVFKGRYKLDVRSMLRVTVYRDGIKDDTFLAINEAVINQGNFARLIELTAEINQRKMVRFKADGVIVATPTGSTAHSLSAGGPIVHPQLDALIFTPICPSTLSMCPIVIPSNRQLTIKIETKRRYKDHGLSLTLDGQRLKPLLYGDQVKFRHSSRKFHLIRLTNTKYYKVLRNRLHWGD